MFRFGGGYGEFAGVALGVMLMLTATAQPASASIIPAYSTAINTETFDSVNPDIGGTIASTAGNPAILSAHTTFSGATYIGLGDTDYEMVWRGSINPDDFPAGSILHVVYDFDIDLAPDGSGEAVNWMLHSNTGAAAPLNVSGVATGSVTHITGDLSEVLAAAPTSMFWETSLRVYWSGETSASTMTINVPSTSSIELSVAAPEPGSLSIAVSAAVSFFMARRRRA